jgi:pimeloyl-ACP methyl ester carboxylesterase
MAAALLARRARAEDPAPDHPSLPSASLLDEDLKNLRLVDATEAGRRFTLVFPKYAQPEQRLPLLVLLHGLGETTNERLGAYAWIEKYGLGSAWQRMKRAPIEKTSKRGEWTDARLAEVNAELAARPFRGFVIACPFMPNPSGPAEIDAYARWIAESRGPRARREGRAAEGQDKTYLGGVSLGGYVSLEVLVRTAGVFGAWGGVQTAIGDHAAPGYAEKIAKAWQGTDRPLFILTSQQDHWKHSSEALAAAFTAKGLRHVHRVIPGPHDQPWLREAGTIETLLWFDRIGYGNAAPR